MHIEFIKLNESIYRINCERSVLMELNDCFSFFAENYKWNPKFKKGWWDGKIKLVNLKEHTIPVGLKEDLIKFCEERDYTYAFEKDDEPKITRDEAIEFIKSLNIPSEFDIREYQVQSFVESVNSSRNITLSATSSGKTMLMYYLIRYYNLKTLIITPLTGLITQVYGDFDSYGYEANKYVSSDKNSKAQIITLTWQTIQFIKDQDWFDQFDLVIVDEVHSADAVVLSKIISNLPYAKYRFGLTGTLKDSKTSEMQLKGLFGIISRGITTRELIDQGFAADIKIKAITLRYPEADRKACRKLDYPQELDFILQHPRRNIFIKNLILSLKGNTLVLFRYKEKHGIPLYELLKEHAPDRKVYYVSGDVEDEERDAIKAILEAEDDVIVIASDVFTTGISIKKIHNMVFTSPSKARIKTLQSIGRGLRMSKEKLSCLLVDLSDDFSYKKYKNYTLQHFIERIKMYNEEGFEYQLFTKELK